MNSLHKNTLEERQAAMRIRHRPIPVGSRLRRKVAALVLLQNGRSIETVAAALNMPVERIRVWIDAGCPLTSEAKYRLSIDL